MAGFGGAVKLTGESEYKKALASIRQSLQETGSALTLLNSKYSSNDKSMATNKAKISELNGILDKQTSAYNKLKSSMDSMQTKYNTQAQAHAKLQAQYDTEKAKLSQLEATVGKSSQAYLDQKAKVSDLATQLSKSSTAMDTNANAISRMQVQLNKAGTEVNKTKNQIADLEKAEDKAGNEADDLGKKSGIAGKNIDDLGKKSDSSSGLLGKLGGALKAVGKVAIAGVGTLSAGVIAIGKSAISSYAEYEQLVGGVDTLFKTSSKTVQKYADEAYKTAGMSANEYMSTVTSFSASLLQGLGGDTAKASKIANMAIIDMSDNANKMGTSMEMIQNAYQGFAKQNYTMLDNLKLGYGGTKSEMARLVKESGILGEAGKDLTAKNLDQKVSYDQIIQAIHTVQSEMGITGTTSKEASTTIEGSVNSMKSAWNNLLTGMAGNTKDMDKLITNFVDSVETVVDNLAPVIIRTAPAIINGFSKIFTKLKPKLLAMFESLKPALNATIKGILNGMGAIIKSVVPTAILKPLELVADGFRWLIDNKELVISAVTGMLTAFAVVKLLNFASAIKNVVSIIASAPTLIEGAKNALQALNITASANPYILLAGAIAGLVTALGVFIYQTDESRKAYEAERKEAEKNLKSVNDQTKAYNDLVKERDNMISAGNSEIDYTKRLWTELDTLIDKNGQVKKGYEDRVNFIASELKNKLGIEIDTTKNLRGQYDKLGKSIDDVIQKKKASILMESSLKSAEEAIKNQDKAYQDLTKYEQALDKANQKLEKLKNDYAKEVIKPNAITNAGKSMELQDIEREMNRAEEILKIRQDTYDKQLALVDEYNYNISQYNANEIAMQKGKYDQIKVMDYETAQSFAKTGDYKKAQLESQLATETQHLESLKRLRKSGNDAITQEEINAQQTIVDNLKANLSTYNSTVATETAKTASLWDKSLAEDINTITGKNIIFQETADGNVQAYINGVETGQPVAEEKMSTFIGSLIDKVKKGKKGSEDAGKDIIDGIKNGIDNKDKKEKTLSSISIFGNSIIDRLKTSVDAHSPSKDAEKVGKYVLDGLKLGIQNKDKRNSIFTSIANFGSSLLSKMKNALKEKSPSKATEQMGKFLIQGLNNGVNTEGKKSKKLLTTFSSNYLAMLKGNPESYTEAGKTLVNNFTTGISNAITSTKDKVSNKVDKYFNNLLNENTKAQEKLQKQIDKTSNKTKKKRLQKQLEELKSQNKEISDLYNKFGKDVVTKFGSALEKATEGVTTELANKIDSLTSAMQKEIDDVNSAIESMRSKLAGYGDLYSIYTDEKTGLESVALSDITKQTEALNKYYSNLTKLKGKVSEDLLAQVTAMDVDEATRFSETLLSMDSADLQAYNKAYSEKLAVADKISKTFYADKLQQIKTNYTDKITAEFNKAKTEITKIGKQTMQGFIKGMESNNYTGAVKKMADNIIKQMKKSLGIKSPSRVFMEIGDYSAQGYGVGFTNEMKQVAYDMKNAIPTDLGQSNNAILDSNTTASQLDIISAFKTALSQMKIELDDHEVGAFVDKTVANAIYN